MLKKDWPLRVVNFNENRNKRKEPTEAHKNCRAKHNIKGAFYKTESDTVLYIYTHDGLASDFLFEALDSPLALALALEFVRIKAMN